MGFAECLILLSIVLWLVVLVRVNRAVDRAEWAVELSNRNYGKLCRIKQMLDEIGPLVGVRPEWDRVRSQEQEDAELALSTAILAARKESTDA